MTQSESASPTDPRFPSGPWIGFYQQGHIRSRQRLMLTFANGRIAGSGTDPAGTFDLSGTYDTTGAVAWTKSYCTHRVLYDGSATEGDGIPGTWTIKGAGGIAMDAGQFHIWPDEVAMEEAKSLRKQEPAPAS